MTNEQIAAARRIACKKVFLLFGAGQPVQYRHTSQWTFAPVARLRHFAGTNQRLSASDLRRQLPRLSGQCSRAHRTAERIEFDMATRWGAWGELPPGAVLLVAYEVGLPNLQPVVAEDVVGGGDVKIEVRHREMQEIARIAAPPPPPRPSLGARTRVPGCRGRCRPQPPRIACDRRARPRYWYPKRYPAKAT